MGNKKGEKGHVFYMLFISFAIPNWVLIIIFVRHQFALHCLLLDIPTCNNCKITFLRFLVRVNNDDQNDL